VVKPHRRLQIRQRRSVVHRPSLRFCCCFFFFSPLLRFAFFASATLALLFLIVFFFFVPIFCTMWTPLSFLAVATS
jgi:hypothetical protein